jgi:hypothetical protein
MFYWKSKLCSYPLKKNFISKEIFTLIMVNRLIIFILVLVVLSLSVLAVPDLNVTGVSEEGPPGDYANANGNYSYVGTNDNSHDYWKKEVGASDYYIYFENGFDGWILVYENSDSHAVAGDSPDNGNYFVRGENYADGAEGSDYELEGYSNAIVNNITEAEEPTPVAPEFSDYAIALLLLTVVGGFFVMHRKGI